MYYASLEAKAKELYREKLSYVVFSIRDDPYLPMNDGRFVNDMAIWLRIEYGHIIAYFITRPVVYTQQHVLSWKQLDAFSYFPAGYVRTVSSFNVHVSTVFE